jgi:hypothetical protein
MYLLEDDSVRLDVHQTACRHQHPLRPATAHTISDHPGITSITSTITAIINSAPLEYKYRTGGHTDRTVAASNAESVALESFSSDERRIPSSSFIYHHHHHIIIIINIVVIIIASLPSSSSISSSFITIIVIHYHHYYYHHHHYHHHLNHIITIITIIIIIISITTCRNRSNLCLSQLRLDSLKMGLVTKDRNPTFKHVCM